MATKTKDYVATLSSNYSTQKPIPVNKKTALIVSDILEKSDVSKLKFSIVKDGNSSYLLVTNTKATKGIKLSNYSSIKYIKTDIVSSKKYELTDIIANSLVDNTANIISSYDKKKLTATGTTNYNDKIDMSLSDYAPTGATNIKKNKGLTINGENGDDEIKGTTYNDTITGGLGENTFNYTKGMGADTINLTKGEKFTLNIENTTQNFTISDLKFEYVNKNKDLKISFNGDSESSVTLKNFANKDVTNNSSKKNSDTSSVELKIGGQTYDLRDAILSDGTYLYQPKLNDNIKSYTGTWLADYIDASGVNYTKAKTDKNTGVTLNGKGGNDTIIGSAYNDTITGGAGVNTIKYDSSTFGNDTINLTKGEVLNINFEDDLENANLKFEKGKNKNDLLIKFDDENTITLKNYLMKNTGATVYINGEDISKNAALDAIDEDYFLKDDGKLKTSKYTGTALADVIDASGVDVASKTKKDKAGNTVSQTGLTLNTGLGDDKITGTQFDDTITGGLGENTIVVKNKQFGTDTINLTKGEKLTLDMTAYYSEDKFNGNFSISKNDLLVETKNGTLILKNFAKSDVVGENGSVKVLLQEKTDTEDEVSINLNEDNIFNYSKKSDRFINGKNNTVTFTGTRFGETIDTSGITQPLTIKAGAGVNTIVVDNSNSFDITVAEEKLNAKNIINFKKDIDGNYTFTQNGNNLIISNGTSKLTVNNYYSESTSKVTYSTKKFQVNGTDIESAELFAKGTYVIGGSGTINGDDNKNTIIANDYDSSVKASNDTITGGKGADTINAGRGKNTIKFNVGDGADIIEDGGGTDTLVFDNNVSVSASYNGNDLVISYGDKGDTVTLQDYANGHSVKNIQIGNNRAKSIDTYLPQPKTLKVGDYNIIQGTDNADIINASLISTNQFNIPRYKIFGGGGNDTLKGNNGNDYLYGGAGDDVIIGGTGNDTLFGGSGSNKFYFNTGDGQDFFYEDGVDNTLIFNNISSINNLTFSLFEYGMGNYSNYDLVIKYSNNDTVTIKNFLSQPDSSSGYVYDFSGYKIQAGANGTPISLLEIVNSIDSIKKTITINDSYNSNPKSHSTGEAQLGNQLDNMITGRTASDGADTTKTQYIFGMDGKDTITANGSDVDAGSGDDIITYDTASTYVYGGSGNDILNANGSFGYGGDGDDVFYGIGSMSGDRGNDKFYLQGSSETSGTRLFSVETGSGNDYIDTTGVTSLAESNLITITTGEGVNTIHLDGSKATNIILGNAETYRDISTNNGIEYQKTIESNMYNYNFNIYYTAYEKDGDLIIVSNRGGNQAEEYDNSTSQTVKNDGIGAGITIIKGYTALSDDKKANIKITFLPSNPYVNNGFVYPYKEGGAIMETYTLPNFLTSIVNNTDEISTTLEDFKESQTYTTKWFNKIDNTATNNTTVAGTNNADYILGGTSAQTINAGAGNDVIYANDFGSHDSEGNYIEAQKEIQTTINGEGGNDYIIGSTGVDVINGGTGRDYIHGGSGNDTLIGGSIGTFEGATSNALMKYDEIHGGDGDDTIYSVNETQSYQGGETYYRNFLYGEEGDDTIYANGYADQVYGGEGDDTIYSYAQKYHQDSRDRDTNLFGGSGDDKIHIKSTVGVFASGDEGEDLIDASESTANYNELHGGEGNDTIYGGSGTDYIYGGYGDDIIDGGDGNDTIYGSDYGASQPFESDTIHGGAGNDKIHAGGSSKVFGDSGNDTVYIGNGTGNEPSNLLIDGGSGNDVYIHTGYRKYTGHDTIVASAGKDIIKIGNYQGATHIQFGDDLVIVYTSDYNQSSITLKDYYNGADFSKFRVQTFNDQDCEDDSVINDFAVSDFIKFLDNPNYIPVEPVEPEKDDYELAHVTKGSNSADNLVHSFSGETENVYENQRTLLTSDYGATDEWISKYDDLYQKAYDLKQEFVTLYGSQNGLYREIIECEDALRQDPEFDSPYGHAKDYWEQKLADATSSVYGVQNVYENYSKPIETAYNTNPNAVVSVKGSRTIWYETYADANATVQEKSDAWETYQTDLATYDKYSTYVEGYDSIYSDPDYDFRAEGDKTYWKGKLIEAYQKLNGVVGTQEAYNNLHQSVEYAQYYNQEVNLGKYTDYASNGAKTFRDIAYAEGYNESNGNEYWYNKGQEALIDLKGCEGSKNVYERIKSYVDNYDNSEWTTDNYTSPDGENYETFRDEGNKEYWQTKLDNAYNAYMEDVYKVDRYHTYYLEYFNNDYVDNTYSSNFGYVSFRQEAIDNAAVIQEGGRYRMQTGAEYWLRQYALASRRLNGFEGSEYYFEHYQTLYNNNQVDKYIYQNWQNEYENDFYTYQRYKEYFENWSNSEYIGYKRYSGDSETTVEDMDDVFYESDYWTTKANAVQSTLGTEGGHQNIYDNYVKEINSTVAWLKENAPYDEALQLLTHLSNDFIFGGNGNDEIIIAQKDETKDYVLGGNVLAMGQAGDDEYVIDSYLSGSYGKDEALYPTRVEILDHEGTNTIRINDEYLTSANIGLCANVTLQKDDSGNYITDNQGNYVYTLTNFQSGVTDVSEVNSLYQQTPLRNGDAGFAVFLTDKQTFKHQYFITETGVNTDTVYGIKFDAETLSHIDYIYASDNSYITQTEIDSALQETANWLASKGYDSFNDAMILNQVDEDNQAGVIRIANLTELTGDNALGSLTWVK